MFKFLLINMYLCRFHGSFYKIINPFKLIGGLMVWFGVEYADGLK